jgi:hypothetical protein
VIAGVDRRRCGYFSVEGVYSRESILGLINHHCHVQRIITKPGMIISYLLQREYFTRWMIRAPSLTARISVYWDFFLCCSSSPAPTATPIATPIPTPMAIFWIATPTPAPIATPKAMPMAI